MFRKLLGGLAAIAVSATLALALTNPATFAPRNFLTQQVAYFRINVNVAGAGNITVNGLPCVLASNACAVKFGAVPYNAYIIRGTQQIITNFNSASGTDNLSIGITSTSANELVAAESVHSGAGNQSSLTIASSGSGVQVTGNSTSQTGADGGFDLYLKFANTSGAAPSAGQAIIILEYVPPNDGTCAIVPMGSTAAAC